MTKPGSQGVMVPERPRVLIVRRGGQSSSLEENLLRLGMHVAVSDCGDPAFHALHSDIYDVLVLFSCADGTKGLRVLAHSRSRQRYADAVVVSDDQQADTAVTAMKLGAFDFLLQPVRDQVIVGAVQKAVEHALLHREVARLRRRIDGNGMGRIVGDSPAIKQVWDLIERVAPTSVPVLITGETGTGKALVARAVHDLSSRRSRPFMPVSCASVPETLMESTLFGHLRGAFTGAVDSRRGLFEQAGGGTVLLDEVDTLSLNVQAKLLRVVEERNIQRVGDRHDVPVDFRLVAATNIGLEEAVERGTFRNDLFFRLNGFPIRLPPLRERRNDIPLLAVRFRDDFVKEHRMKQVLIQSCCMDWLMDYAWPGNVRELKHTIERAIILSTGSDRITCESLTHLLDRPATMSWEKPLAEEWSLEQLGAAYTAEVLKKTGGHKGKAARILGIDRRTLYRRVRDNESSPTPKHHRD